MIKTWKIFQFYNNLSKFLLKIKITIKKIIKIKTH